MQGIWFGDKHSYKDFGLITNNMDIGIPSVKTNYIDIPCGNGSLDLTESMGSIKYGNRRLRFDFTLRNTTGNIGTKITNDIHGKKLRVVLDKDNDYYYYGRCHVEEFARNKNLSKITVIAECDPLKYKRTISVHSENIQGNKEFICINRGVSVIPIIELNVDMAVVVNGKGYELKAGKQKVLGIQFMNGHNRIAANGNGTVRFTFREGVL